VKQKSGISAGGRVRRLAANVLGVLFSVALVSCGGGNTAVDTTAPTAPAGLTTSVVSATQINLSWTAATDNVGVTGYRVERCQGASCSSFAQVGPPTTTSYNDTGLTASTSYSYRVRATDAAGNFSSYSLVASATTTAATDTTPPTAPTNLTATAASGTQINLAWTASTDNVAVTGYRVERCQGAGCSNFAPVGTPTTTSFNDTGLSTSTPYSYRVRATDAAGNVSLYSSVATAVTSSSGAISVTISPVRWGMPVSQSIGFTATVQNDVGAAGVTWSASGGTFTTTTATQATYKAPAAAGTVTVTATSVADNTKSASATMGITDLTGVTTYHNDLSRDGVNSQEYALTLANVNTTTFGKQFSCVTDGAIYGQPLWVPGLVLGGVTHNVVFVATQHDSLYAFDADFNTSPCVPLWQVSLIDMVHGGLSAGETPVPSGPTGNLVGQGLGDITPEVGILGTPVIDLTTNTLYAVSKSVDSTQTNFYQRLHAIDVLTGNEKFSGPATITAQVNGDGDASVGGVIHFDPRNQNQRPGLALINGVIYIGWASHEDNDPYHGWVIGYDKTSLSQVAVFNTTPDAFGSYPSRGGVWMGGGAPAADTSNNLYLITGNGAYNGASGGSISGVTDFGDSVLKLSTSPSLAVTDWFAPMDQQALSDADEDFGSGGTVVLVDLPSSAPVQHLLVGAGKAGDLFLLNRDSMGHFSSTGNNVVDWIHLASGEVFATAAFWQNNIYFAGSGNGLSKFTLDPVLVKFTSAGATMTSAHVYPFPGATPSISANGSSNAVVWALDNSNYCTPQSLACGPAVLYAYDAANLGTELWNSSTTGNDTAGFAVKFTVPTVANGKVYVGTRGSDDGSYTSSNRGELDVYGLKPN